MDVATKYLRRAIFEKQLTGLHVVRIIIFLGDMCLFIFVDKNADRDQNSSLIIINIFYFNIFSTFRGEHTGIFRPSCRIPCHSFTCHWIRITFIVLCLNLQSLVTDVDEGGWCVQGVSMWKSDYMKAWNCFNKDCGRFVKNKIYQETGKEYCAIKQMIVKDGRAKAIAWHLVSCKMRFYNISEEKNSLNSQCAFCAHFAVCSVHFVLSMQCAFCSL